MTPSEVARPGLGLLHDRGVAITGLVTTAVLVRILVVAKWDLTTAQAMLASSDSPALLLGTALSLLPIVSPLAALAAFDLYRGTAADTDERGLTGAAAISLAMISILTTPAALLAVVTVLPLLIEFWRRVGPRTGRAAIGPKRLVSAPEYLYLVVGIPTLLAFFTISQPWLGREHIEVSGKPLIGYVLSSSGGWTTVLQDEPRLVISLRDADIASREFCAAKPSPWSAPLTGLLNQRLPDCP